MFICASPFVYLLVTALICISATIQFSEVPSYTVIILLHLILPNSSFWLLQTSIAFNMQPWFNTTCQNCVSQGFTTEDLNGELPTWRLLETWQQKKQNMHRHTHVSHYCFQVSAISKIEYLWSIRNIVSLCHSLWDSSSGRVHKLRFSSLERHLGALQCFITVGQTLHTSTRERSSENRYKHTTNEKRDKIYFLLSYMVGNYLSFHLNVI